MDVVYFLISIIAGVLVNLTWSIPNRVITGIALFFLTFSLFYDLVYWIRAFAGLKNALVVAVLNLFLQWGRIIWFAILGYLTAYALKLIKQRAYKHDGFKRVFSLTLWGASVTIASTFLMATVGKIQSIVQMKAFFQQSGYSDGFLYFIMIAESACAIGILLHFRIKTGIWATTGLIAIMCGAMYTHWHNGDPFSDSYAAIAQLLTAAMLLILYLLEKKAKITSNPV